MRKWQDKEDTLQACKQSSRTDSALGGSGSRKSGEPYHTTQHSAGAKNPRRTGLKEAELNSSRDVTEFKRAIIGCEVLKSNACS